MKKFFVKIDTLLPSIETWYSSTEPAYRTVDRLLLYLESKDAMPKARDLGDMYYKPGNPLARLLDNPLRLLATILYCKNLDFRLTPNVVDELVESKYYIGIGEPRYEFFLNSVSEHPHLEKIIKQSITAGLRLKVKPVLGDTDEMAYIFDPNEMKTYVLRCLNKGNRKKELEKEANTKLGTYSVGWNSVLEEHDLGAVFKGEIKKMDKLFEKQEPKAVHA